ncbi:MAG: MBL fold metallo-hydrolase [Epsilonproteobacteria bacterium]|nr:MBL fold metallo-hydrolase [Campylobacterota bacterium]
MAFRCFCQPGLGMKNREPILLGEGDDHAVYWIGSDDESAFRFNVYLVIDGEEAVIVDPGSRAFFPEIFERVGRLIDPWNVTGVVLCHQDPDVAASIVDWLRFNPALRIIASERTNVLLPHYGVKDYDFYNIVERPVWRFASGRKLRFVEAPFLHFAGAFATYDESSRFLFSGDIWAALDTERVLVVRDFDYHVTLMDLFHIDYMASNKAAAGFAKRLEDYVIDAILPQHGSIIPSEYVERAIDYLMDLQCGLDLIYPDL